MEHKEVLEKALRIQSEIDKLGLKVSVGAGTAYGRDKPYLYLQKEGAEDGEHFINSLELDDNEFISKAKEMCKPKFIQLEKICVDSFDMDIQTLVKISETLLKHYPNAGISFVLNRSWIDGKNTLYIEFVSGNPIWLSNYGVIKDFYRAVIQEVKDNYKPLDKVGLISFNSIYHLDKEEEVTIKSFSKDTAILTDDRKVKINRLWIKE